MRRAAHIIYKGNGARKLLSGLLIASLMVATPLQVFADTAPTASPGIATGVTSEPAQAPVSSSNSSPAVTNTPALTLAANPETAATPTLTPTPAPVLANTLQAANSSSTTTAPADSVITAQTQISSTATSGNAAVTGNRDAGSAKSGEAQANATVVTVANSNTNFGSTGNNFMYYTKDVYDQDSDLVLDSSILQGAGSHDGIASTNGSLQTSVSLTDILNNIVLSANSGTATVDGNRDAGDATSGNASAIANVVNIVGSSISAQQSFLGIVNIYGNLKGNILVPQSFVDSLVDGSAMGVNGAGDNTIVTNNITSSALSGNATVSNNRDAGNATSGNATTNLTVYNLTGQQVVAKNSLLVFVNVLGKWVGMIVQAPGSNVALLGKDITTASTTNSGTGSSTTNITNNIAVNVTSGNATVSNNRDAGNATSGNASAGVNLLNITNSDFKLGDWFGALFINVLGSWIGNFGIKDDSVALPATGSGDSAGTTQPIKDVRIFQFESEAPVTPVEGDDGQTQTPGQNNDFTIALASRNTTDTPSGMVLGTSTSSDNPQDPGTATHNISVDMVALVAMVGALALLIALGSLAVRRRFATAHAS